MSISELQTIEVSQASLEEAALFSCSSALFNCFTPRITN